MQGPVTWSLRQTPLLSRRLAFPQSFVLISLSVSLTCLQGATSVSMSGADYGSVDLTSTQHIRKRKQ
jgi:hypothetical protein